MTDQQGSGPAREGIVESAPTNRIAAAAAEPLRRTVGFWATTAVITGLIIGSGIFRTPSSIADLTGSVGGIALIWILGGLITLCLALCLAELATMFPHAGGLYVYLREAYGPTVAFAYGWTFLLITPAQWAAISLIFAEYAGTFVPFPPGGKRLVAAGLVIFVSAVNYFSLDFATRLQTLATSAKVLALACIVAIVFTLGASDALPAGAFSGPLEFSLPRLSVLGVAIVAVLWPYEGVASACALSGEVRDPGRTLPRALVLSVLIATTLFLLINAAYLYVLPLNAVASSSLVAADAMQAVVGPPGRSIISACVMLATFGTVAAVAIVDPRVFYAMSRDGAFFKSIGQVHVRHGTPHVAIIICAALAVLYLSIRSFEQLAAQFVLGLWLFYALCVAGLMRLRLRRPQAERPYRTVGYPIVPIVFVLAAGGLLVNALVELPEVAVVNLAVTASAVPIFHLWKWARLKRRPRSAAAIDPMSQQGEP